MLLGPPLKLFRSAGMRMSRVTWMWGMVVQSALHPKPMQLRDTTATGPTFRTKGSSNSCLFSCVRYQSPRNRPFPKNPKLQTLKLPGPTFSHAATGVPPQLFPLKLLRAPLWGPCDAPERPKRPTKWALLLSSRPPRTRFINMQSLESSASVNCLDFSAEACSERTFFGAADCQKVCTCVAMLILCLCVCVCVLVWLLLRLCLCICVCVCAGVVKGIEDGAFIGWEFTKFAKDSASALFFMTL